jgi:hypothetical protein
MRDEAKLNGKWIEKKPTSHHRTISVYDSSSTHGVYHTIPYSPSSTPPTPLLSRTEPTQTLTHHARSDIEYHLVLEGGHGLVEPEFVLKQYGPVGSYVRTDRWCRLCGVLGLTPLSCWDWGYPHVGRDEGDLAEFSHSLQHEVNTPAAQQNSRAEESRTRQSRGVCRSQEE